MNELKKEIGKRIAGLRKSKKMNQEDFKNLIDAPTVQMISAWENGHSFPSVPYLVIIAKTLDTSLDYLLLGKSPNTKETAIKTFKDAATYIVELISCGLFTMKKAPSRFEGVESTRLESENYEIGLFRQEFSNLLIASGSMSQELYKQAILELLNKYDRPLNL